MCGAAWRSAQYNSTVNNGPNVNGHALLSDRMVCELLLPK